MLTIPGIDGQKMSKSYNNTIPLFATDAEIEKAVMGIVTDSSGELPVNVYNIHKLFRDTEYLDKLYSENKGKYKILKEALIADLKALISPLRANRAKFENDIEKVKEILEKGKAAAQGRAAAKMASVRSKIGVSF